MQSRWLHQFLRLFLCGQIGGDQLTAPLTVEADLFSGRPNPRWTIDVAATTALLRLEAMLRPSRAGAPLAPPGLGYRGFVYTVAGKRRRAWLGKVAVGGTLFDDPGRKVERLLLSTMPDAWAAARERLLPLIEPGNTR